MIVSHIDPIEFRRAAGQFMTGVTIITTVDDEGRPFGLTANSFSSLSLDPPLIVFGLGRNSEAMPAFQDHNGYVVHVLAADQQELGMRFSTKGIDRFDGLHLEVGWGGLPVIPGALATFHCSLEYEYEGGDHVLLVGRVQRLELDVAERPALCYFRGRYVTGS